MRRTRTGTQQTLSKWSEHEHHASATSGDGYLRGFVAAQPVLVHTEGVEAVRARLEAYEQSLGKSRRQWH